MGAKSENTAQQKLHNAIQEAIRDTNENDDSKPGVLTGWVIAYETTSMSDSDGVAGMFYGPHEMTTWRALGLVEWVRRFCLFPSGFGPQDDDEDES